MASDYAKRAMDAVKKISKKNPEKTSFTATETGARREALKRFAEKPTFDKTMKKRMLGHVGMVAAPSQQETEDMISGKRGRY